MAKCINCGKYTTIEGGECIDCQAGLTPRWHQREQISKPSVTGLSILLTVMGWLAIVAGIFWAVIGIVSAGSPLSIGLVSAPGLSIGLSGLISGVLLLVFSAALSRLSSIEAILQAQLRLLLQQNEARTINQQKSQMPGEESPVRTV